jgi:antitoxin HicB
MADQYVYPADSKQDEGKSWLVTFPDFPETATDGETLDEAIAEARDCLEEAIAARIDEGEDLPKASRCRQEREQGCLMLYIKTP